MRFLSVCSGIEAASVAWGGLGWGAVAFSEIEPFPCAVLAHHYPKTPNWGDMTKFKDWPDVSIDLLCGGTPCQSFSVAGLRAGLDDPRGNLMLTFGAIAAKYRPQWLVWENVPGVLSSGSGRDFAEFLGLITGQKIEPPPQGWQSSGVVVGIQSAYSVAYRVLDAQYFGVAQRRRRVFVVGCLGDWRSAAAVLFERHSLSGHPAPGRQAREVVAPTTLGGARKRGGTGRHDFETETFVTHSLRGEGFDASEDGTGRGTPLVPVGVDHYNGTITGEVAATLSTGGATTTGSGPSVMIPVAFHPMQDPISSTDGTTHCMGTGSSQGSATIAVAVQASQSGVRFNETVGTLDANYGSRRHNGVMHGMQVRRLTPTEAERLQGFPDGYTAIPWRGKPADQCPDGPRYKALGNSWAVPNVRWIGERIQAVDALRTAA